MAYHFAEPALLPRRAIAAGGILALHVAAAYFLATGLIRSMGPKDEPSALTARFLPDALPQPPQTPAVPRVVLAPQRFTAPRPDEMPAVTPVEVVDQRSPTATTGEDPGPGDVATAADPIRLIGRNQLPAAEEYYPAQLRRLGVEGVSYVRVCVDANGLRQGDPAIEQPSEYAQFDAAAVNLARHGRFARSMQGSQPVSNCHHFRIWFRMR